MYRVVSHVCKVLDTASILSFFSYCSYCGSKELSQQDCCSFLLEAIKQLRTSYLLKQKKAKAELQHRWVESGAHWPKGMSIRFHLLSNGTCTTLYYGKCDISTSRVVNQPCINC